MYSVCAECVQVERHEARHPLCASRTSIARASASKRCQSFCIAMSESDDDGRAAEKRPVLLLHLGVYTCACDGRMRMWKQRQPRPRVDTQPSLGASGALLLARAC